jgi:hypothetical protein
MSQYKSIIVCDIDGCICPSVFPNLDVKANVEEIKEKIPTVKFYEQFINFYNLFKEDHLILFMTGRQSKFFYQETLNQFSNNGLIDFKAENIYFFPDSLDYSQDAESNRRNYFGIRLRLLSSIILNAEQYIEAVPERIYIIDDIAEYFPDVKKLLEVYNHYLDFEVILKKIDSNEEWKEAYSIKIY